MDFLTLSSKKHFETLHESSQFILGRVLSLWHANKFNVQVTSGSRTFQEQQDLYDMGRTKSGRIITNAQGGHSMHNYGIAMDVVLLNKNNECDWRPEMYDMLWRLAATHQDFMDAGLIWAGNWKSMKEYVHFDLSGDKSVDEIKAIYPLYIG
jgi:peptidoglycan L-alanyl-D-glutamate endopeptidase CwlK